jgi:hypothetical protein
MPAISAAEAISPAIQRTKWFLFRPFSLGTYLKLCLVALLTEGSTGGSGNFRMPGGSHSTTRHSHIHTWAGFPHFAFTPARIAAAVAILLLLMLIGLVITWLITRLRFAYFHCLATNTRFIRPGWYLYASQATRFFWLNIVVGFCFLALMAILILPFAAGFLGLFHSMRAGGHPNIGAILALLLPMIPVILLIVVLAIAVDIVLRDFMLPHYALENATAGQAWSAVWARIRFEKGSFVIYALLRILLPIVASIGIVIVLLIPAILFILAIVAVEVGIHAALGHAAVAILLQVCAGAFAAVVAALVVIAAFGPLQTAVREYALVFYGGRYRTLGDILYPPPPPAPIPAPAAL